MGRPGRPQGCLGGHRMTWADRGWYGRTPDGTPCALIEMLLDNCDINHLKNPIGVTQREILTAPNAETNFPKQTISLPPGALPHCPSWCSSYEIQFWLLIVQESNTEKQALGKKKCSFIEEPGNLGVKMDLCLKKLTLHCQSGGKSF